MQYAHFLITPPGSVTLAAFLKTCFYFFSSSPLFACSLPFQNLLCLALTATAATMHLCSWEIKMN